MDTETTAAGASPTWSELERLAIAHGPDLIVLVDPELRAVWANGALERVLGEGAWALVGTPIADRVHPEDLSAALGAIGESLRSSGYHLATRLRVRRLDGTYLDSRVNSTTFEREDGTWMVLSIRPVEDDVAIARRRAQLKGLSQSVYLTCAGMHWYEEQERVVPLLVQLAAIVGARAVQLASADHRDGPLLLRSGWTAAEEGADLPGLLEVVTTTSTLDQLRLAPCLLSREADAVVVEVWLDAGPGVPGVMRLLFNDVSPQWDDANADIVGLMGSTLLATMRRCQEERRLHEEATRDPLTRLLNRSALLERLGQVMDRTQPGYRPPVVLFADLNHFKALNDTRGHLEGDKVLATVAGALESVIRSNDLAARIGGDEFVVVFDAPQETASELVARVRTAVDRAIANWPGLSIAVGAIAVGPTGTPEEVLEKADQAMYLDKASRRFELQHRAPNA